MLLQVLIVFAVTAFSPQISPDSRSCRPTSSLIHYVVDHARGKLGCDEALRPSIFNILESRFFVLVATVVQSSRFGTFDTVTMTLQSLAEWNIVRERVGHDLSNHPPLACAKAPFLP